MSTNGTDAGREARRFEYEPFQTDEGRPHAYMALIQVALARGQEKARDHVAPGECLEIRVDDHWRGWVNPHKVPAHFTTDDGGMAGVVPPFNAWINYNGWLWGLVDPYGGVMGDHPDEGAANPERFERDCIAAISRATNAEG